MSIVDTQNRIQFLETLKRNLTKVLALNTRQASELVSVVFAERYDLSNPKDIGDLIFNMQKEIDTNLYNDMYRATGESINQLTDLGINQVIQTTVKTLGPGVLSYMDLGTQLAQNYIESVNDSGKKLSDLIWSEADKKSIYNEVYSSIRKGESSYQLAQNIEKQVAEGTPMYSIKRVATTEMNNAYSRAKDDIARREQQDYEDMIDTYVTIKLSPSHSVPDICDEMKGTYRLGDVKLPSYHTGCLCDYHTFIVPKGKYVRTK